MTNPVSQGANNGIGGGAPALEATSFASAVEHPPIIASGQAVGDGVAAGAARFVRSGEDLRRLAPGEILLAEATRPEWEPAMGRAGGIVTNQGGASSHAAQAARKLGIPAVIGTIDGASPVWTGARLIVSCADGRRGLVCEDLAGHAMPTRRASRPFAPG